MDLVPHIYHEKQERGSMLCGQHALNNLLQSALFTAPDLAEIARRLDALEASQLPHGQHLMGDSPWESSQNYDDSGFFSVQVMEEALKVWGLRLVRWGSKEMQPIHNRPELVEGFLLNHQLHWFSIRQFGNADRFYNLDSCIPKPTWISAMYLGLTLREMELQGYSIFAVVSATDGQLEGLPPCAAADVARTLPPPRGAGSNSGAQAAPSGAFSGSGHSLAGGNNAFASTSASASAAASSGPQAGAFSTMMGGGQNGFAGSSRKGKRAASPDEVMGRDEDDEDDDIIIEEHVQKAAKSSVDTQSEKRRRRRRLEPDQTPGDQGRVTGGSLAFSPGLSKEDQMAAAIAASLRVSGSGNGNASGGTAEGGSGSSTSATSRFKTPGGVALSEEEEFRRAVAASLAEASGADPGGGAGDITESEGSGDEEAEDSPSMEELRRRRMARFGGA
ncbi:hypothetical protein JCM3774_001676 [Rhodotorula dairenensis]